MYTQKHTVTLIYKTLLIDEVSKIHKIMCDDIASVAGSL